MTRNLLAKVPGRVLIQINKAVGLRLVTKAGTTGAVNLTGEFSPFSYLQASILKRELEEFGALWHGCYWSTYTILATPDDDVLKGGPVRWRWAGGKIDDLRPRVEVNSGLQTKDVTPFPPVL